MKEKTIWHPASEFPESGAYVLVVYNGRRSFVKVWCEQEGERFSAVWFNMPYVRSSLHAGEEYLFYGEINGGFLGTDMTNPSFEPLHQAGLRRSLA